MHRRSFLPLLFAAAIAACHSDGPTAVSNNAVRVVREGSALRITNLSDEPRAYAAFDPNWLALADLSLTAFCATQQPSCLRLPAHGSVLVKLTDVGGYSASTTTIQIYTWRVLSDIEGVLHVEADDPLVLKL